MLGTKNRLAFWGLIMALIVLSPKFTMAQHLTGVFPSIDSKEIDDLLKSLKDEKTIPEVPGKLFGDDLYNPNLANLIIFVSKENSIPVNVGLTLSGKAKDDLFGANDIWVMVFLEVDSDELSGLDTSITIKSVQTKPKEKIETTIFGQDSVLITTSKTTEAEAEMRIVSDSITTTVVRKTVSVRLSRLDYRVGTAERIFGSLLGAIPGVYTGGALQVQGAERSQYGADSTYNLGFEKLGRSGKDTSTYLFFAIQKLPLRDNTINRVRVRPLRSKSVFTTFGNYSASRFAVSIGVAPVYKGGEGICKLSTDRWLEDLDVPPYLFLHIYMGRPKLPQPNPNSFFGPGSFSIAGGINLENLTAGTDDMFLGISIGHLIGSAGILFGINLNELRPATWQVGMSYFL